jgi:hypothetical protein
MTDVGAVAEMAFRLLQHGYLEPTMSRIAPRLIVDAAKSTPPPMVLENDFGKNHCLGRVAEWLKAPVLKTGVHESVPGVRIPPRPLERLRGLCYR